MPPQGAQAGPAGGKKQQACTLKELCAEDKAKVAQLVKQVVELGQERERLKAAAQQAAAAADAKLRQIQDCNKQAVRENCSLKNKLGQAVTVLRMYHHKVQGLDAALRAMHSAAPPHNVSSGSSSEPAAAAAAAATVGAAAPQQPGSPARRQACKCSCGALTRAPADVALTPAKPRPEPVAQPPAAPPAGSGSWSSRAEAAAAATAPLPPSPPRGQQQQPQLPSPPPPQQQQQLPLRGAGSQAAALGGALASPLLLACEGLGGVGAAVQDLAAWQLGQAAASTAARRVLQFDPSVGSHGAFLIQEVPQLPPQQALPPLLLDSRGQPSAAGAGAGAVGAGAAGAHGTQLPPVKVPRAAELDAPPGLGDASPWAAGGSPTTQQLLGLAKAFDSLASAPPAAQPGDSAVADPAAAPAAASGTGGASVPAAAAGVAVAAVAGSAAGQLAVEEVEVEELDVAQLPVLVRNEKPAGSQQAQHAWAWPPASSRASPASAAPASRAASAHSNRSPPRTWPLAAGAGAQQQLQQQQQALQQQALQQRQQQKELQQQLLQQQQAQQQRQQQEELQQQLLQHQRQQQQELQQQLLQHQRHLQPQPQQQLHQQHWQLQQERPWQGASSPTVPTAQPQPWRQPGGAPPVVLRQPRDQLSLAGAAAPPRPAAGQDLAASDARELLERFDESLLDVLAEVECLEQLASQCRGRAAAAAPQLPTRGRNGAGSRHWAAGVARDAAWRPPPWAGADGDSAWLDALD